MGSEMCIRDSVHPAPAGSSGWFLPSQYELATLFFGAPIHFSESGSPYYYENLQMLNKINPQIAMASGNKLIGEYWSSNESSTGTGTVAWRVNLALPGYGVRSKADTYKVRAVLAF